MVGRLPSRFCATRNSGYQRTGKPVVSGRTPMTNEQLRAAGRGLLAAGALGVAIFVGSRNLRHIDAALVGYTFACLFAAFGLGYRYSMWLQRPATRMYWK